MAVTFKIEGDFSQVSGELKKLGLSFEEVKKTAGGLGDGIAKGFTKGVDEANMSMLEMRQEIKRIEASFKTLSGEQLKQAQIAVGKLRNEMADAKAMMKTVGEDAIPVIVNGLRGLIGVAQTVTGSLAALGIETKGLDKAMMGLINVSMGMSQVWEMYEKKTLSATASLIRNSIATTANTAATNANNVATKALYTTIAANPLTAALIGVAALAAGIYFLATANDEEAEAEKRSAEEKAKVIKANEELAKQASGEMATMMLLINQIDSETATRKERQAAIDKLDKMYPGYLDKMDKERLLAGDTEAAYSKMTDAIMRKAVLTIYEKELNDVLVKQITAEENLAQITAKYDEGRKKALEEHIRLFGSAEKFTYIDLKLGDEKVRAQNEYNAAFAATGDVMAKVGRAQQEMNGLIVAGTEIIKKDTKAIKERKYELTGVRQDEIAADKAYREELSKNRQDADNEMAKAELDAMNKSTLDVNEYLVNRMLAEWKYTKTKQQILEEQYARGEIGETEYQDKLTEIEAKAWQERIKKIQEYFSISQEAIKNAGDIASNLKKAESNKLEEENEIQTKDLEKEYDKRLAAAGNNANKKKKVDEWYSAERKKLEEEVTAETLALEKKYRTAQQAIAISNALISGAQGIAAVWANPVYIAAPPLGAAMTAFIAANTATQVGVITSQKYAKGGTDVLNGPSHYEGGISFGRGKEAEGGERWAIFSRSATNKNPGLADFINAVNDEKITLNREAVDIMMNGGKQGNTVVIANFKGGEHLTEIRDLIKEQNMRKNKPGYERTGIRYRKYLN